MSASRPRPMRGHMDFRMPDGGEMAGWAHTPSIFSLTQHINKCKEKHFLFE